MQPRVKLYMTFSQTWNFDSDPPINTELKYVRIYFKTPTFDVITKDKAAKLFDKMSTIGGTMGLFTGFSIISGIEIIYFIIKMMNEFFRKDLVK